MAVPVRGAKVLFEAIFKSLRNEEYPSIDSNLRDFLEKAFGAGG
jgi:hypothetical protein